MDLSKNKVFLLILFFILIFCTGCNTNSEESARIINREGAAYTSSIVTIQEAEYYCDVSNIITDGDNYYAFATKYNIEDLEDNYISIYSFTDEGVFSECVLDDNFNAYVATGIHDDKLYFATWQNELKVMDLQSGDVLYSDNYSEQLCGVSIASDGYVLSFNGKIEKYDWNNNFIASIQNDEWNIYDYSPSYFEQNDECYLVICLGATCKYYSLDFGRHSSELIYDTGNSGITITSHYKEYLFTDDYEYKIDFENRTLSKLASWNDMNYQPPRYGLSWEKLYGVNDYVFISAYTYVNGISEILIYEYDTTDYSERIPIVIGGYYCSYDLPLRWAIYNFNTSQDEYRAYIEEYSDVFGWTNDEEAVVQRTALIQYFIDGNAPDIFYGNYFDYDSLNYSGYIQDMSPYLNDDSLEKIQGLTSSIYRLLVEDDGSIYSLFSSYCLKGYIGSSNYLSNEQDYSVSDLLNIANDNNLTTFNNTTSTMLAGYLFGASLYDGVNYSTDDIETILTIIYENSFSDDAPFSTPVLDSTSVGDILLFDYDINALEQLDAYERNAGCRLAYVGYPSLDESYHVVQPYGQMGLSSSTSCPEACVQLMMYLLDEDVQRLCYTSFMIPVMDSMLEEEMLYYSDHSSINPTDYATIRYFNMYDEVSANAVEDFRIFCNQADTIIKYDWGISSIISEEVQSYYSSDKPISEIAEALYFRLDLYIQENYN